MSVPSKVHAALHSFRTKHAQRQERNVPSDFEEGTNQKQDFEDEHINASYTDGQQSQKRTKQTAQHGDLTHWRCSSRVVRLALYMTTTPDQNKYSTARANAC
jgi:hypothetical protein